MTVPTGHRAARPPLRVAADVDGDNGLAVADRQRSDGGEDRTAYAGSRVPSGAATDSSTASDSRSVGRRRASQRMRDRRERCAGAREVWRLTAANTAGRAQDALERVLHEVLARLDGTGQAGGEPSQAWKVRLKPARIKYGCGRGRGLTGRACRASWGGRFRRRDQLSSRGALEHHAGHDVERGRPGALVFRPPASPRPRPSRDQHLARRRRSVEGERRKRRGARQARGAPVRLRRGCAETSEAGQACRAACSSGAAGRYPRTAAEPPGRQRTTGRRSRPSACRPREQPGRSSFRATQVRVPSTEDPGWGDRPEACWPHGHLRLSARSPVGPPSKPGPPAASPLGCRRRGVTYGSCSPMGSAPAPLPRRGAACEWRQLSRGRCPAWSRARSSPVAPVRARLRGDKRRLAAGKESPVAHVLLSLPLARREDPEWISEK